VPDSDSDLLSDTDSEHEHDGIHEGGGGANEVEVSLPSFLFYQKQFYVTFVSSNVNVLL
jgi:hypothetical protein